MPVSDLNPYQPSPDFQQRLQQHGLHWDSPATLTPCRNEVAHQLLPQQKAGFSLARLMSVLMLFVGLFLWVPTLWAAEVVHITYSGFSLLDLIPFLLVMQAIVLVLLLLMILSKQLTMATPATPPLSSLPTTPNRAPSLSTDNTPLCPIARIPQAPYGAPVGLLLAAATRQGLVRTDNQDACISHQLTPEQGILIVCDGVGGHPGGAEASTHATEYLLRCLSIQLRMHSASQRLLHTALLLTQQYFAEQQFVGLTTALIVVIENDQLYYATLGDGDIVVIHRDSSRWYGAISTGPTPRLGSAKQYDYSLSVSHRTVCTASRFTDIGNRQFSDGNE